MTWQPPPAQFQPRPPQADNDLAVAGLCLSLASLAVLVIGTPFTFGLSMLLSGPLAIAGLVCGIIAKQKADRGEAGGRSMAQAGFVLGIVSLVLHVVAVILGVALIALLIDALGDLDVPEPDQPPEADPA